MELVKCWQEQMAGGGWLFRVALWSLVSHD